MRKIFVIVVVATAFAAHADDGRFTASDVPNVHVRRGTTITIVGTPRARAANTPAQFASMISDAAQTHGVDPRLVAAVASRESAWNPNAISRTGACGLMQLMPATARYLGVANVFDTRENLFAGARYLRTLLDAFNGDLDLTLAAYNAGPGAVQKFGGVPPFPETQQYVKRVRAAYEASLR